MYQPQLQPALAGGAQTLSGAAAGVSDALRAPTRRLTRRVLQLTPERLRQIRDALREQLADDWRVLRARAALGELAVDLGHDIGSRHWWYGAVACSTLVVGALNLGTRVEPIRSFAPPALTPAQHDLARIHAIAPLARGGVTGTLARPNPQLMARLAEAPERPRLELSVSLGGAGFGAALRRSGVSASDMAAVNSLLRGVADTGRLARGTDLDLVLGRRESKSMPRPLDRLAFRAAFDLRVEVTRADGVLTLRRIPIAVDSTPLRVTGTVGGNLQRALRSAGIPARLVGDFTRIMGYVVDFQRGVGKNDRFDIIVEQDKAETGEVRHGALLFAGLARRGKDPIEVGRQMQGNAAEYFKSDGEGARRGLMKTPVDGARLTSGFGMRFHPLLSYSRMHQGVDFGAPHGAPIMAAASGTVNFAGRHGGHGNYIQLRHTKELVTAYAHLSRFAVKNGQRVVQGQVIGYVGSTGLSTGPHLHYEVWLRGRATNPVSLRFIGGSQLTGRALNQFMAQMNRWRAIPATGSAPKVAEAADKRRGRA